MTKHRVGDFLMFDLVDYELGVIIEINEGELMPYTVQWADSYRIYMDDKALRKYKMNFNRLKNDKT